MPCICDIILVSMVMGIHQQWQRMFDDVSDSRSMSYRLGLDTLDDGFPCFRNLITSKRWQQTDKQCEVRADQIKPGESLPCLCLVSSCLFPSRIEEGIHRNTFHSLQDLFES